MNEHAEWCSWFMNKKCSCGRMTEPKKCHICNGRGILFSNICHICNGTGELEQRKCGECKHYRVDPFHGSEKECVKSNCEFEGKAEPKPNNYSGLCCCVCTFGEGMNVICPVHSTMPKAEPQAGGLEDVIKKTLLSKEYVGMPPMDFIAKAILSFIKADGDIEKGKAILKAIRNADVGSDVIIHNEDGSVWCAVTVKCKEHVEDIAICPMCNGDGCKACKSRKLSEDDWRIDR